MSLTSATVTTASTSAPLAPKTPRTTRSPRAARMRKTVLPPVGAALLFLALWQGVVTLLDLPPYLLPGPLDVWNTLLVEGPGMIEPTLVTMQEAYLGFLVAAASGFLAAMVMARWGIAERGLYPYLVLLQTIPIVAIAPLFVVWFGAGVTTNVLVAAMIAVFPVAANTLQGLKSTDRNLVQLYRMAGAPPRVQMFSLRIPAALPHILTGLRIASGSSVIGAIVGEFVAGIGGGAGGLGYVITLSATQLRTAELFVAVLMASAVSLILFAVVALVENQLLKRWHESALPAEE